MCYSSQIHAAYKDYLRFGGVRIDIQEFAPQGKSDAELFTLLDEGRQRPYYEHQDSKVA